VLAFGDATYGNDRHATSQLAGQHPDDMRALVAHRSTGQAARLIAKLQSFDPFAAQGGIGRNHRIHPGLHQRSGYLLGFFVAHVRGYLDRQRHPLAMLLSQGLLALAQGFEQLLERVTKLQAAQPRGVWRADVISGCEARRFELSAESLRRKRSGWYRGG
jgi:hypothetical protein